MDRSKLRYGVGYIFVKENNHPSSEFQQLLIRKWADEKDVILKGIFIDKDGSHKERFSQSFNAISRLSKHEYFITYSLFELSESLTESSRIMQCVRDKDCSFVSTKSKISTGIPNVDDGVHTNENTIRLIGMCDFDNANLISNLRENYNLTEDELKLI